MNELQCPHGVHPKSCIRCTEPSRPAIPESETPDSLLGVASRELRRIRDDNLRIDEPDFHTMTGAIEDLERRLAQAQAKLEEADTALRIRSTECLMQSQRAAQAQTRIAELEKSQKFLHNERMEWMKKATEFEKDAARYRWLKANHLQTGADSWIRTGNDLEEAIDSALKSRP